MKYYKHDIFQQTIIHSKKEKCFYETKKRQNSMNLDEKHEIDNKRNDE